jgi:hypothetical protein
MKFSYRQILASAGGAVLSAVIASVFGIKGTIVGVALGSIAATTGTAVVLQSIEKTNKAVKQVAVRAPDNPLLRRLGGTDVAGVTDAKPVEAAGLTEETATSAVPTDGTVEGGDSDPTAVQGSTPAAAPEAGLATAPTPRPRRRWPLAVVAVVAVFVFALGFVTVLEVIVGRPLADLFGHSGGGTTVDRIFQSPPTTLPAPTTTTTTSTSTTTTTSTSSSSTTTTSVGETTTTGVGSTTTLPTSTSTTLPATPSSTAATNTG